MYLLLPDLMYFPLIFRYLPHCLHDIISTDNIHLAHWRKMKQVVFAWVNQNYIAFIRTQLTMPSMYLIRNAYIFLYTKSILLLFQ